MKKRKRVTPMFRRDPLESLCEYSSESEFHISGGGDDKV